MNIKAIFASRLKQLREEKELSQSELGERLGVSRGTISFYESQKRTADIEFLAAAASFFEVDYDYLMGVSSARIGKNDAQKTLDDMGLSNNTISIIKEQNAKYITNPINLLCGDNLPENPGKSAVLHFFNSIMMYYLYMADAKEQPEEMGIKPIEGGIVLPFRMAADFLIQTSMEYLNLIIKNSIGVIPHPASSQSDASIFSFKIHLKKLLKAVSYPDEIQYQTDLNNFEKKSKEWEEKVKHKIATESEYLQWLKDVKEGDMLNGND